MYPDAQVPGVYHRRIGDIVVTTVSDGYLDGNLDVMRGIDVNAAHKILAENFHPARRTSVNTFLLHSKGRIALVDTGCGDRMAKTSGQLMRNLEALSLKPADIDTVLLTHMHPDHAAGLTSQAGEPLFPNSEVVAHEAEMRHWFDEAAMARVDERSRKMFFKTAQDCIAPYKQAVRTITDGEVFPGVFAVLSPGHTPGRTSYLVASGNDQLMIWGDTVHVPEVQTAHPEAGMSFDTDISQAVQSRRRMFERVVDDGLLVAGMHTHFPGFARLVRHESGYRLIPEAWQHVL